jgi:hypothetical protein
VAAEEMAEDYLPTLAAVTQAMLTGRPVQLRRLGIFVDEEAAVKKAAEALKIHTKALTDQQKHAAINAAVMEKMREKTEKAGATPEDAAGAWAQTGAAWRRTKESAGRALGPAATGAANWLTQFIERGEGIAGGDNPTMRGLLDYFRKHPTAARWVGGYDASRNQGSVRVDKLTVRSAVGN